MKKMKSEEDDLRPEYQRSDFTMLVRGKHYERAKQSSNVVVLKPELAAVFPNSAAVNEALQSLLEVARKAALANRSQALAPESPAAGEE